MIPDAAVVAVANELHDREGYLTCLADSPEYRKAHYMEIASSVLAAATPYIRAQALNEAADAWQARMDTTGRGSVEAKTFMQMRAAAERVCK